jgi:hypothetical protein
VRKFSALAGRDAVLIANGFDGEDFTNFKPSATAKFVIRHVGIVNEKCDPRPFMHAVKHLVTTNTEFAKQVEVSFVGDVHIDFRSFVLHDTVLAGITSFVPPVPHKSLLDFYATSSLLILILTGYKDAEGYMPGKLFEYMATGLPILGVGPVDGDAAKLLASSNTGVMIDNFDQSSIESRVLAEFRHWKNGDARSEIKDLDRYSRKGATKILAEMIDQLQK